MMPPVLPAAPIARDSPTVDLARVYAHLSHLADIYPNFDVWFWRTAVPDVGSTRRIFVDDRGGQIRGVVIAKRSVDERKLCTVWVETPYRGQAVGARLMRKAMEWMDCQQPLISVPASRLSDFRTFFEKQRFVESQLLMNYYRVGETEHVFNGSLPVAR